MEMKLIARNGEHKSYTGLVIDLKQPGGTAPNPDANYFDADSGTTTTETFEEILREPGVSRTRFQRRPYGFTLDDATGSTRVWVDQGERNNG